LQRIRGEGCPTAEDNGSENEANSFARNDSEQTIAPGGTIGRLNGVVSFMVLELSGAICDCVAL